MSSATVGMVRPQVVPPTGGVFGKPPALPAVPEKKKKKQSLGVPKEGMKDPKVGKSNVRPKATEDPVSIMSGGKPKKEMK